MNKFIKIFSNMKYICCSYMEIWGQNFIHETSNLYILQKNFEVQIILHEVWYFLYFTDKILGTDFLDLSMEYSIFHTGKYGCHYFQIKYVLFYISHLKLEAQIFLHAIWITLCDILRIYLPIFTTELFILHLWIYVCTFSYMMDQMLCAWHLKIWTFIILY